MSNNTHRMVWFCKIGGPVAPLPKGADGPMRAAISRAYKEITGNADEFLFSGWGGELTEGELAVVENRQPVATTLEIELARFLNGFSLEQGSNTPDFILAQYLLNCLSAFNVASMAREKWYGRPAGLDMVSA